MSGEAIQAIETAIVERFPSPPDEPVPADPPDRILAIDPGSARSAWVVYDVSEEVPIEHGITDNEELLDRLRWNDSSITVGVDEAVIEWMQPRGMPTSAQEFETLYWIGRFVEAAEYGGRSTVPWSVHRLSRLKVKQHVTGSNKANDSNIIAALTDRYGGTGGRKAAVGTVKEPGPLHGVRRDVWQALALAITRAETR